jgi:hypothetical protein
MENAQTISASLRGLSFSTADLVLIRSWAEARDLDMTVRLDQGADAEEHEEILTLCTASGRACRFILWRDSEGVFVQPLIGRIKRYASVPEAIAAMTPHQDIVLTDVRALCWPEHISAVR